MLCDVGGDIMLRLRVKHRIRGWLREWLVADLIAEQRRFSQKTTNSAVISARLTDLEIDFDRLEEVVKEIRLDL